MPLMERRPPSERHRGAGVHGASLQMHGLAIVERLYEKRKTYLFIFQV